MKWPSTFPALAQRLNGQPLAYLDSAATTLRPQSVIDALVGYYSTDNANPTRVHTLGSRSADHLANARRSVAQFINAPDPSEVIFVRGSTEGINLVSSTFGASLVGPGDRIILTITEHVSNLLPWTRVAQARGARVLVLDVDDEGRPRLDQFEQLLGEGVKLVTFTHVSNVLGYINPVKEMCAMARRAGARTVVDGAQGIPHGPVDVQDLDCDFYIFSGHKMLGPMATGIVWGRRELLDAMPPYHVGSNMAHAVDFEGAELEHGGLKFQSGTPDVAGPVGLVAAIQFFQAAGADAIRQHDRALAEHGLAKLTEVKGLRILGSTSLEGRVPVFTFVIEGHAPEAIARALDARGIAIRAGDMAALPLMRRFGVTAACRASVYVYSTTQEIDRLAEGLRAIAG